MKHEVDTTAQGAVEGRAVISPLPKTYKDTVPVAQQQARQLVIIESPFSGEVVRNIQYAHACILDSLSRDEAPIASHLLYTQVLDDDNPISRHDGIEAGLAWYRVADKCAVYTDRGISAGMRHGIARAEQYGVAVEYRTIGGEA